MQYLLYLFAENDAQDSEKPCSTALSWVSSVAVCRSSDLAASGAGNGSIRLWKIESESKGICPLFELPLVRIYGFSWVT